MRVGLIAWDYPPSPSGLSTAAREIAESLVEAGVDVTVFAGDRTGREEANGVAIVGCRPRQGGALAHLRLRAAVGHLAAPLAFRRAVLAAHRERPFDVVEATNWYAPGALLATRAPFPLVVRNSTPAAFSRDPPVSLRDRADCAFADRLERRTVRRCAGVISNTGEGGRVIVETYGLAPDKPRRVIGLSLPPAMLAAGRRAAYPEAVEPVRVLFVGRAEARKGFDCLMRATEMLSLEADAGALPAFELRLVGIEPGDLPIMPVATRQRIAALGRVGADALHAEYEAAHAVAAPSRFESFGLVYQEAMAYGRPVVACALDASAREFVGSSGAGLMASEASGPALAEPLRRVIADPDLRQKLRAHSLAAAGRFTRETLGEETLAFYRDVLAQPR
ncbi:glycosyltransferase family 4 protein [Aureimonas leprariae]|uniref:Glycosyltransferase family 4 protein n=1 Tax=Plantimonas leprariae TaxID=2615207 RepID=A0A7V7TYE5_9HYPH|nr:glycosyltransferase family 4 protein [Aureimonas leprariae]KAB0682632.1 glycosyltransferase family 4 protein [Aureimonas leprariae]